MIKTMRYSVLVLLAVLLLVTACSPDNQQEPTQQDTSLIYTAAAQTVESQLTSAALQNPPTNTPEPAPTETQPAPPTAAPAAEQQGQAVPTTAVPGQVVSTATPFSLPTVTATNPPPASDQYELLSQTPSDNTLVMPGLSFDMIWELKNTGTTTWTELYTVEFFMGDRIGGNNYTKTRYYFREPVAPGESTYVIVDMEASNTEAEYYSWWKLKNEDGANFGDVDVTIIVSTKADDED